jgi:hypothetical protein
MRKYLRFPVWSKARDEEAPGLVPGASVLSLGLAGLVFRIRPTLSAGRYGCSTPGTGYGPIQSLALLLTRTARPPQ